VGAAPGPAGPPVRRITTQITIIGAGNMARGIATRALSGGHTVRLINREPDKAAQLAAGLQENSAAADVQAAGATSTGGAHIVVLALPYPAARKVAAQYAAALSGKTLVDISNPVDFSTSGGLRPIDAGPLKRPRPGSDPRPGRRKGGEQAMDCYGLTVEVSQEPGHMLITVTGEVDIATAPQLRQRLAGPAASGRPIIVDLDPVSFIDATGLGVLASAASRTAAHGASLHVVCARHQVRRLFTITGLDRHIPLARTMTQACHNLAAAPGRRGQRPPPAWPA
jgi:anti-anti-sigma factor